MSRKGNLSYRTGTHPRSYSVYRRPPNDQSNRVDPASDRYIGSLDELSLADFRYQYFYDNLRPRLGRNSSSCFQYRAGITANQLIRSTESSSLCARPAMLRNLQAASEARQAMAPQPSRPGDQLRELRNRLGVTTREVEEFSRRLAENSGNEEFYISNAWLTQLENKDSVPSIYKLFSLSIIYRTRFEDLLAVFGIDLGDSARYQLDVPLANTHLVAFETPNPAVGVTFPIRLDRSFSVDKTSLVSRVVEVWGQVPVSLIQQLDVRHTQYGYI